jgi:hypothetical protein
LIKNVILGKNKKRRHAGGDEDEEESDMDVKQKLLNARR